MAVDRAAAAAGYVDSSALSLMLYTAGSLPVGARAHAQYDARRVHHLVSGAVRGTDVRHRGGDYWHVLWVDDDKVPFDSTGGLADGIEGRPPSGPADLGSRLAHKVYVSPMPADLGTTCRTVAQLATDYRFSFKIGGTAHAVHRPDKIVLYFPDPCLADETAIRLDAALAGLPPHGVPFTGQVGRAGLISRGLDQSGRSWRMAVCDLVGRALDLAARSGTPTCRIADVALDRVREAGLDTDTFGPARILAPAVAS
jgi:hypothetical protein